MRENEEFKFLPAECKDDFIVIPHSVYWHMNIL
jgi:hypothetical protein